MTHRYDIDFLRAIAVVAVILFHLETPLFAGGYVGVDVFFVISGFLITKLLLAEIQSTSSISFTNFYVRRAKRLLPALFSTIFFTSILCTLVLSPDRLKQYGASALHAALSISNLYFYFTSDYFDSASFTKPLLHTWSLGVEEQFYLFWPALLFALSRLKSQVLIFYSICSLLLLSLFFSQYFLSANSAATFFIAPFRIFEFSIGALVIYLPNIKNNTKFFHLLLYCIGLLAILYSVLSYDSSTSFPGFNALLPCFGAFLCLYSGKDVSHFKFPIFKFVNYVGIISYSLYLIHWPVIVLYREYFFTSHLDLIDCLIITSLTLFLSIIQFNSVENKFRFKYSSRVAYLLLSILLLLIIYASSSMWALNGWAWRTWVTSKNVISTKTPAQLLDIFNTGKETRFVPRNKICSQKGWGICDQPSPGATNVLVIGDSHAVDALNAFTSLYPSFDYSMSTLGGCPPFKNIELITPSTHPNRSECKELNSAYRFNVEFLKKFDLIVINNLMSWYTSDNLLDYLNFLHQNGIKKVIVFGNYYTLSENMYELVNKFGFDDSKIKSAIKDIPDFSPEQIKLINQNGYLFISKKDLFCKDGVCEIFDDQKVPFTYDEHHLSYEFASRMLLPIKSSISQYIKGGAISMQSSQPPKSEAKLPELNTPFKVQDWGPRSTKANLVPNIQPNGNMGIWIKISNTDQLKNATLYFDGKPAAGTYVQDKLVTASINPKDISSPGRKEITLKMLNSEKLIPIGSFTVDAK